MASKNQNEINLKVEDINLDSYDLLKNLKDFLDAQKTDNLTWSDVSEVSCIRNDLALALTNLGQMSPEDYTKMTGNEF